MKVHYISDSAVRAGLSQGSLSSPVVASKVVETCLDKISKRFALSYLDDITIGEKSVEEAQATLNALAHVLQHGHPSSPLFLKFKRALKIGEPVDILGYWPRPKSIGGLRFSPSNKSLRRFYVRLATKLLQLPRDEWDKTVEAKAYAYASSARNWAGVQHGREFMQTAFWDNLDDLLDDAHPKVLTSIKAGMPDTKIEMMAAHYARSLIPESVLATPSGLTKLIAT